MKTHRWFTLAAAIVITALETWLFNGASASAPQIDVRAAVLMVTPDSGDTP